MALPVSTEPSNHQWLLHHPIICTCLSHLADSVPRPLFSSFACERPNAHVNAVVSSSSSLLSFPCPLHRHAESNRAAVPLHACATSPAVDHKSVMAGGAVKRHAAAMVPHGCIRCVVLRCLDSSLYLGSVAARCPRDTQVCAPMACMYHGLVW